VENKRKKASHGHRNKKKCWFLDRGDAEQLATSAGFNLRCKITGTENLPALQRAVR
jgi:hypothetical protein